MADFSINNGAFQTSPASDTLVQNENAAGQNISRGMDWATQQAQVDVQKQHVQNEVEKTNQYKKEFDVKMGTQSWEKAHQIAMMEDGPTKKAEIKRFAAEQSQSGYPLSESAMASLNDKAWLPKYSEFAKMARGAKEDNPNAFDETMAQAHYAMGDKDFTTMFDKGLAGLSAVNSAMQKGANTKLNLDAREVNKAMQLATTENKNNEFSLNSIARLNDLVGAATKGEIKTTTQLLKKLQIEEQRILVGSGQLTEGTAEAIAVKNLATVLNKYEQEISSAPKDADIKPWIDQIMGETKATAASYMGAIDTKHAQLREGFGDYPAAQRALDKNYAALRGSMARKDRLGGWFGFNQEGVEPQKEAAAPPKDKTSPVTTEQKAKAAQFRGKVEAKMKSMTPDDAKKYRAQAIIDGAKILGKDALDAVGLK